MPTWVVHRNVAAVVAAGQALGIEVVPRSFPDGTRTAAEAAAAIGVGRGQIVKSLVFDVDGAMVMALVSGSNRLDEARLATAAGGTSCRRPDADAVRQASGFPIGGVPPFGHATPLATFVDEDLLGYDQVWAAAGTGTDVFGIAPAVLVIATGGVVVPLAS